MIKLNFSVDEDTSFLVVILTKYLKKYFGYDSDELVSQAINNFYSKMRPFFENESEMDFFDMNFHHDHPFLVACKIHFQNSSELQNNYSDVVNWLRDVDWFNVPSEANKDYETWSKIE